MTKRFAIYLALAGILVLTLSAFGQMGQGPFGGGGRHGGGPNGHQMPSVDDQVKDLTKQLKLTDEQQPKVRDLLQKQRDQTSQVMQDNSLAREDKHAKMRNIHDTTTGKIRDLLTDDQKKKYDDYLQKQQQNRQHHHGGGMASES
jgi:Spy/CpxP family protein refolding chaperone